MSEPHDPYRSAPDGGYGQQPPESPTQPSSYGPSSGYGQSYGSPDQPPQGSPYGQYGQPAGPSQPLYGQPGSPSQTSPYGPYGPYGQPTGPSQPLYGQPGQPSAQQWGPPPPGFPGAAQPAPRKRSLRGLWIALGSVLALVVVSCTGAGFALAQYVAPATAAGTFCANLKAQHYGAAYTMLSAKERAQLTSQQFVQASQALDQVEGKVVACGQAKTSGAYTYSLGGSSATLMAVITRGKVGSLQGVMHLKSENGGWKVDGLETSLLGVNLGALATASAFCAALQAANYSAAYALLGTLAQSHVAQADFAADGQAHDQIDGSVSACQFTSLGESNTDSSASLAVSITRAKLGQRSGSLSLDVESGAWKISGVAASLQGTDVGPLQTGRRFCTDLASANYSDLYGLLTDNFTGGLSEAEVANVFNGTAVGVKFSGCTVDSTSYSTYKLSGTSASYDGQMALLKVSTGQSKTVTVTFKFVLDGTAWKLDDFKFK